MGKGSEFKLLGNFRQPTENTEG